MATSVIGNLRLSLGLGTAEYESAWDKAEVKTRGSLSNINRMVQSFSGQKLLDEADRMVQAIEKVGGVSKLTQAEIGQLSGVIGQLNEKFKVLGKEVPPHIALIERELKQLDSTQKTANTTTTGFTATFGKMVASMVTAQAVISTVRGLWSSYVGLIQGSIESFANAEAAQTKLVAALKAQGTATPEVIKQQSDLAAQFQRTTVYADDLLMEMQGLLVQVGNVMPNQMQSALKAATDLASGLGIDLRTATMLVGKAFEGETGTLKRYGIVIDETKLKTEGVTAVLDAIQQKFGGQAQAEVATYAGQIKQLANNWDDLKERIGAIVVQSDEVKVLLSSLNSLLKAMAGESEGAASGIGKLWSAWDLFITGLRSSEPTLRMIDKWLSDQAFKADAAQQAALAFSKAPPSLPVAPGLPNIGEAGLKIFNQEIEDHKKRLEEAKRAAEAFKKAQDQLFGRDLINRALDMSKQLGDVSNVTKLTAEKKAELQKAVTSALEAYRLLGMTAPKALHDLDAATRPLLQSTRQWAFVELKQAVDNTTEFEASVRSLGIDAVPQLSASIHASRLGFVGYKESVQDTREGIAAADKETRHWSDGLGRLSQSLANLSQVSGGFGGILQQIATIISSMDLARKASESMFAGLDQITDGSITDGFVNLASGVIGAATALLQATAAGNTFQRTLGGIMAGAQAGSAFGPIGTAIGAIAGGLTGFFRGMFGVSDAVKKARTDLEDFQKTLRGTLTEAERAGRKDWEQDVIAISKAYVAMGKTIEEAERDAAAMWDTDNPERSKAAIDRVNKALEAHKRLLQENQQEANDLFNSLVQAAEETGERLPETLLPTIDRLKELGLITDEQAAKLRGLVDGTEFNLQQLQEDAKELGIDFNALGPKFQQAGLQEKFEQLYPRINRLIAAGGDVGTVLSGAADEISTLVQEAMKFGTSIPQQFKPWIQELINAGKLLDENGQAITDITKINFGDPLVNAIDKVISRLDIFLSRVDALFTKLSNTPREIPVTFVGTFEPPENAPNEGAVELQRGTMGVFGRWFPHFSSGGTPAYLHGEEAVVPKSQLPDFAAAVMAKIGPFLPAPSIDIPLPPSFTLPEASASGPLPEWFDPNSLIFEKPPAGQSPPEVIRQLERINRSFDDFSSTFGIMIRDAVMGAV